MNNPYTSMYMPTGFEQSQQGLNPVFQNMAQQQANQNAALAQQNQQVQQAGQTTPQGGGNALALAQALRKTDPNAVTPVQNAQAWMNSKFGRDPLQPDIGQAATTAQQFYGDSYNPNAGWSS